MTRNLFLALALAASRAWAGEELNLSGLDRLAAKADETVNVTLDAGLLKMASGMFGNDSDSAELKKLVAGLRNITVRSFEFKKSGEYTQADVDAIRAQLRAPDWKRIVEIHSKKDGASDVYLRAAEGRTTGLAVIVAEPKELTIISVDGAIDAEGWKKLSGNLGLPGIKIGKSKDDEE